VKTIITTLTLCVLAASIGCGGDDSGIISMSDQLELTRKEKTKLAAQLEKSKADNEQLKKQVKTLSGAREEATFDDIHSIENVEVTSYTNLYDKNDDGKMDTLIVYLKPSDAQADVIKAPGEVDVELWDLNKPGIEAKLGKWQVKPDELKKLWFATLVTINYRLTFDVTGKIEKYDEPLTVKVTFTDHLSGKTFKEQKVIKPK
jgi:hypothetical protein